MNKLATFALISIMPTCSFAIPQFYFGVGANAHVSQNACTEIKKENIGFDILAGSKINDNFSQEVSFKKLGSVKLEYSLKEKYVYNFAYNILYRTPLFSNNSLHAFATIGVNYLKDNFESFNTYSTAVNYGAGIIIANKPIDLRFSVNKIDLINNSTPNPDLLTTLNVDIVYNLS